MATPTAAPPSRSSPGVRRWRRGKTKPEPKGHDRRLNRGDCILPRFKSRPPMPAFHRFAAFAAAMSMLVPFTARAMDDTIAASSSHPIALKLCRGGADDALSPDACRKAGYDTLVAAI